MNQLLVKEINQTTKKKKKGFTLIELIIVIAIIAILAAIAIPKFGAAKHDADVAADQANAKIIATAVSNAVANGKLSDADHSPLTAAELATVTPYIDGGAMPKPKIGTAFSVSYTQTGGVVITTTGTGGSQVYPIS